jgi:hypothetical protein
MKNQKFAESHVLETKKVKTQNWYAWINKMPPQPNKFHIRGDVEVSNPGVEVALHKRQPQGINPAIIILDLFLIQRPGTWPALVTLKTAAYEEVGPNLPYNNADVFHQGESVASVPVQIIQ